MKHQIINNIRLQRSDIAWIGINFKGTVAKDVVAGFYLKRIKTGKFYYPFCSPEASFYIVNYLVLLWLA